MFLNYEYQLEITSKISRGMQKKQFKNCWIANLDLWVMSVQSKIRNIVIPNRWGFSQERE